MTYFIQHKDDLNCLRENFKKQIEHRKDIFLKQKLELEDKVQKILVSKEESSIPRSKKETNLQSSVANLQAKIVQFKYF